VRLTDCDPKISECYGVRCYLSFRCPHAAGCEERIAIPFDPPLDGKALPPELKAKAWSRTGGDAFETMTLTPSIWLHATEHDGHPGWHGFLTNGELKTC
jgi:hypothetical protein